eukprot:3397326-Rhodomonas_salina.1
MRTCTSSARATEVRSRTSIVTSVPPSTLPLVGANCTTTASIGSLYLKLAETAWAVSHRPVPELHGQTRRVAMAVTGTGGSARVRMVDCAEDATASTRTGTGAARSTTIASAPTSDGDAANLKLVSVTETLAPVRGTSVGDIWRRMAGPVGRGTTVKRATTSSLTPIILVTIATASPGARLSGVLKCIRTVPSGWTTSSSTIVGLLFKVTLTWPGCRTPSKPLTSIAIGVTAEANTCLGSASTSEAVRSEVNWKRKNGEDAPDPGTETKIFERPGRAAGIRISISELLSPHLPSVAAKLVPVRSTRTMISSALAKKGSAETLRTTTVPPVTGPELALTKVTSGSASGRSTVVQAKAQDTGLPPYAPDSVPISVPASIPAGRLKATSVRPSFRSSSGSTASTTPILTAAESSHAGSEMVTSG